MDEQTRARLVLAIEERYRWTLYDQLAVFSPNPYEREQIAAAVLTVMLRKMFLVRGEPWLEQVLKMVLQPEATVDSSSGPSASPTTS